VPDAEDTAEAAVEMSTPEKHRKSILEKFGEKLKEILDNA